MKELKKKAEKKFNFDKLEINGITFNNFGEMIKWIGNNSIKLKNLEKENEELRKQLLIR